MQSWACALTSQNKRRLKLLASAIGPPSLDLGVRISGSSRVPLDRDGPFIGLRLLSRRSGARALLGPIGEVDDLLVQAERLLYRRLMR
jgi:hypothetical protein